MIFACAFYDGGLGVAIYDKDAGCESGRGPFFLFNFISSFFLFFLELVCCFIFSFYLFNFMFANLKVFSMFVD